MLLSSATILCLMLIEFDGCGEHYPNANLSSLVYFDPPRWGLL
jgi:hypothetical protein